MFPYGHPDHQPPEPVDVHDLAEVDPGAMSLDELDRALDGLEANRRRDEALLLLILGEFDDRDGAARRGAVSVANDLAYRHGRAGRTLRAEVNCARKLRKLPGLAAALASATITAAHADALTAAMTERTEAALLRDEAMLVRLAHRHGVDDFRQALRFWAAHADAGAEPDKLGVSELRKGRSRDGDLLTKGQFNPEDGATIERAINQMLDELHGNGADDSNGEPAPLPRRQAQALVELCRRGANMSAEDAPSRRTRPQLVIAIDREALVSGVGLGQFDTGETLPAMAVRRLACDADVIAAVFGTDSELLDLGRKARLVSPAQRAALVLRDGGCTFPNCDRPASWCEAHHIVHWIDHGPTDLDNLTLMCAKHHHLMHEGGWSLRRAADGSLEFTQPSGLTLPSAPRLGGHPDPFRRSGIEPEPPARRAPTADSEKPQRHRPHPQRPQPDRSDAQHWSAA